MEIKNYLYELGRDLVRKTCKITDTTAIVNDRPKQNIDIYVDQSIMGKLLSHVEESWEQLGKEKPHFSVITSADFLPENFLENENQFWHTGTSDVRLIDNLCQSSGLSIEHLSTCLEYGCGVGRATVQLAKRFPNVLGLDISKPHLDLARKRAIKLDVNNIKYEHINIEYLNKLPEFDFLYTRIVLQHNPPPIMRYILEKLLRKLSCGGVAIFQIPVYMRGYTFNVEKYLDVKVPQMEMHSLPQVEIFNLIHLAGCRVKQVRENGDIGNFGSWVSNIFVVTK